MKFSFKMVITIILFFFMSACAIPGLYYLGFHGPSINLTPDSHDGGGDDMECLDCHGPDAEDPEIPPTTHPGFHGCLKCHNDEVKSGGI